LGLSGLGGGRLSALQSFQELSEGRAPENRIELAPIAGHEAHTVHRDVIHSPPPIRIEQAVFDRHAPSIAPRHSGLNLGIRAIDALALKGDGGERIARDGAQVDAFQHFREEPDEFVPLLRRRVLPVLGENPARDVVEVEHIRGGLTDLRPTLPLLGIASRLRLDDREHARERRLDQLERPEMRGGRLDSNISLRDQRRRPEGESGRQD
jgi:hypothetical protein